MPLNCVATKSQVPAHALPGDVFYDNSTGEVHIAIAGGLVVPLLGFLTGKHECGRPGRDGEQGASEPVGPAGAPGRDGVNGRDGTPGVTGEKGERGERGATGATGQTGATGAPGERGSGATGEKGARGEPGERGEPGRDGLLGAPGRDGTSPDVDAIVEQVILRIAALGKTPADVADDVRRADIEATKNRAREMARHLRSL